MRHFIIFSLFLVFIWSCDIVDNDTGLTCIEDCTGIFGKVYTRNNLSVKNVALVFRYQKSGGPGSQYTRKIAKDVTDVDGRYDMNFYLQDDEIGPGNAGLELYVKENTVGNAYFYHSSGNLFGPIDSPDSRNVVLERNFYLPTKKEIIIRLSNFVPLQANDSFSVLVMSPCGFDRTEIDPATGNNHNYVTESLYSHVATSVTQTFEIAAALDALNFIRIMKIKDGAATIELLPIFVDANSNIVYDYQF